MLNSAMINLNYKPENLLVVKQEGVIIDAIHSQAFLFGEFNVGRFKRKNPLCKCGCKKEVKLGQLGKWNKFINGHNRINKTMSIEAKEKISKAHLGKNNAMYGKTGKMAPMYGIKRSSETKKKISKACKNPSKETRKKIGASHIGKIVSDETKLKMSIAKQNMSDETKLKISRGHIEKIVSDETKLKMSIANSGKNNPSWKGGISFNPYCDIWLDKEYKNDIKERDNYTCQNPDCRKNCDLVPLLSLHHINYIKKDCRPKNIITLCRGCNSRANFNRKYWTKFYQNIMTKRLDYCY